MSCIFLENSEGMEFKQSGVLASRKFEGTTHVARRCEDCGHVFFPEPSAADLDKFYQDIYPAGSASWYNVETDYAHWKTSVRARRVVEIAEQFGFGRDARFHEVGAAFGGTVHELNSMGYATTGTELNRDAVKQGQETHGNDKIFAEDVASYLSRTQERPNVIYGYHVLEHIPNPVSFMKDLSEVINDNSIVIWFLPNAMAAFPNIYHFERYVWFGYPEHVNLYSPASSACLAKRSGFTPLKFGSRTFEIQPDATNKAVGTQVDTPVSKAINTHMVEGALMAEELIVILAKAASATHYRYLSDAVSAQKISDENRSFEKRIRELGATTDTPNPF